LVPAFALATQLQLPLSEPTLQLTFAIQSTTCHPQHKTFLLNMRGRQYKVQKGRSTSEISTEKFRVTSQISTLADKIVFDEIDDDSDDGLNPDFNDWMLEAINNGGWFDTDTSVNTALADDTFNRLNMIRRWWDA
jgi:hypothetical protein